MICAAHEDDLPRGAEIVFASLISGIGQLPTSMLTGHTAELPR